jgi:tRNA (guanine26-N2/guanine27-N2)-dimethyltransferase
MGNTKNRNRKRKHDAGAAASTTTEGGKKSSDNITTTSITEGSATMTFPSDQESTVFYNPVQVQNRDLSVLMISLFAERRAIRRAVVAKRKQLNQQHREQQEDEKASRLLPQELQAKLKEYEDSLDGRELVSSNSRIDDDNKATNNDCAKEDGITILDALAASGLRSVRYWNEIPGVKHVTINDLEEAATERARDNLQRNNLQDVMLEDNSERKYGICVHHGDATHEMYMARRPQQLRTAVSGVENKQQPMWDVIDLDPYGSAAPFLDGAVQAVESGGLLCITCTDMAALGGSHPETAYGRYASLPIQSSKYLQELALRILLHTIAVSAARYGRTIRPILSVGMAFYVRVFVEVHNDKRGVNGLSLQIGHVYQSTQCSSFVTLPHGQMGGSKGNVYQSIRLTPSACSETGAPFKVGGPMWLGPLHDQNVVQLALKRLSDDSCKHPNMEWIATRSRLQGLLTSVSEELDTPLYYQLPDLSRVLHCSTPPIRPFKAALVNAGYKVSGYHKEPQAIKTNAPSHVVWDIMRVWVEKNPPNKPPAEDSPGGKILASKPSIEVDFSTPECIAEETSKKKISRFPQNPEKFWGPKKAHTKRKAENDAEET